MNDLFETSGRAKVGNRDIALLVDLSDSSNKNFHDAVAVISIDKPASTGGCTVASSSSSASSVSSSSSSSAAADPNKDTDGDSVKDTKDWCPLGTAMPEAVPTEYMSFDRYALTAARGASNTVPVFRTGPRKLVSNYTIADMHGCSCAQILDAIQDKGSHKFGNHPVKYRQLKNLFTLYVTNSRQFGCSDSLMKLISKHDDDDDND
jgi:hypothetical protein